MAECLAGRCSCHSAKAPDSLPFTVRLQAVVDLTECKPSAAACLHPDGADVARMAQACPTQQSAPTADLHDLHQHPPHVRRLTFALQLVTFSSGSWCLLLSLGIHGYHQ